ncbi:MAG: heat-inducible transcription repressor HrcA [Oscillospiraceae bacterium]|nr:heat-inducible transcription repressor HrcA [Oscillospiraceae bacterium]
MTPLDPRKQQILALVIRDFVHTGEPVGSVTVMQKLSTAVSSATIRNDMAFLERCGLLTQPHTSAGRVPTQMGYRYYIDGLMQEHRLSEREMEAVHKAIRLRTTDPENLVQSFAESIASFTHLVSIVSMPAPKQPILSQIQVIRVGKRVVFAALASNLGVVKNRSFKTDFDVTDEDLVVLNTFLNAKLCHIPLDEISPAAIQTMITSLGKYALTLSPLVVAIYLLAKDITEARLFVSGKTNLLHNSTSTISTLRLLRLLESPEILSSLMRNVQEKPGVLLGVETGVSEMEENALILAPYQIRGKNAGSIGILGPERMNYQLLLPYVKYFAHYLGEILSAFYEV